VDSEGCRFVRNAWGELSPSSSFISSAARAAAGTPIVSRQIVSESERLEWRATQPVEKMSAHHGALILRETLGIPIMGA